MRDGPSMTGTGGAFVASTVMVVVSERPFELVTRRPTSYTAGVVTGQSYVTPLASSKAPSSSRSHW